MPFCPIGEGFQNRTELKQRYMRKGKYLNKKQFFVNIPLLAASVLFWLVVITTYLASNLYAKYTTSGTATDSARIMAFGKLTVTDCNTPASEGGQYVFVPGVPLKKQITIAFTGSNADCFVFVKAETTGWVPNETHTVFTGERNRLTWSVSDNWTYLCSEENYHVYYRPLSANTPLEATDFIKDGEVYVYSPIENGSPIADSDTRNLYASDPLQLNIHVTAYAVQANGFSANGEAAKAAEAWSAVRN